MTTGTEPTLLEVPQPAAADLATRGASQPAPLPRIPKRRYCVDSKSYHLAKYFLGDNRDERIYEDLAQQIQDTVEDFCREVDREPPEPDGEAYRGTEYASALAEEQARIQRELK